MSAPFSDIPDRFNRAQGIVGQIQISDGNGNNVASSIRIVGDDFVIGDQSINLQKIADFLTEFSKTYNITKTENGTNTDISFP